MKNITFGRERIIEPYGTTTQVGTDDGIISADFVDFVGIADYFYLVSLVKETTKDSKYEKESFYVKEALVDLYADGTGALYLNNGNDNMCKIFEEKLNESAALQLVKDGKQLSKYVGNTKTPRTFEILTHFNDELLAEEIDEDLFEEKKHVLETSEHSFSDLETLLQIAYLKKLEDEFIR